MIDAAWKDEVFNASAPQFKPSEQALTCILRDLELNRPASLALRDGRAFSDVRTADQIANFEFNEIATTQLAIDCQVEEFSISSTSLTIEEEAHGPNLFLIESPLRANLCAKSSKALGSEQQGQIVSKSFVFSLAGMAFENVRFQEQRSGMAMSWIGALSKQKAKISQKIFRAGRSSKRAPFGSTPLTCMRVHGIER